MMFFSDNNLYPILNNQFIRIFIILIQLIISKIYKINMYSARETKYYIKHEVKFLLTETGE